MKPWYRSKMIWVAIGTALAGLATAIAGSDVVTPQVAGWFLTGVGILNLFLRSISDERILLTSK